MDERNQRKLEWLRKEIQKGIDSLEKGQYVDGPEAMKRIRERLMEMKPESESIRETKPE